METILTLAIIASLPLIIHLIVSGFKKSIIWGLGNLLFGFFTMPFYYFIYRNEFPIISGISFIIYAGLIGGTLGVVSFMSAVLTITIGCIVCLYIIISEKDLLSKLDFSTNSKIIKIGGHEFQQNSLHKIRKRHIIYLKRLNGKNSIKYLMSFWTKEDFINDTFSFIKKYMLHKTDSISGVEKYFYDERFKLFKKMMMNKYKISDHAITLTILFFNEELSYLNFSNSLNILPDDKSKDILKKLVHYNIENYSSTPDSWILRLMKNHNFEKNIINKRAYFYNKVKEEIKISYFEDTLHEEETVLGNSLESEIRRKKLEQHIINLEDRIRDEIESIVSSDLDLDIDNYIINPEDYSRASRVDAFYRREFSTLLSRAFDGHCCKCGNGMVQLEFDHFWYPKSKGGNFLMRHRNGYYVNNCIPLCGSCNSSKGKKEIHKFFGDTDEDEIEDIVKRCQSINAEINIKASVFNDPHFVGRAV